VHDRFDCRRGLGSPFVQNACQGGPFEHPFDPESPTEPPPPVVDVTAPRPPTLSIRTSPLGTVATCL
jgi:hypothetical protein